MCKRFSVINQPWDYARKRHSRLQQFLVSQPGLAYHGNHIQATTACNS